MIKRNRNRTNRSAVTATPVSDVARAEARAMQAELNGRPAELDVAPPDPDSATAWMSDGNCRLHPPATFFPSDGAGVERARKICRGCPVADQCLDYALTERIEHGVWGGRSERDRRRILKQRRIEATVG